MYDEATITIHGAHGSRLGEKPYILDSPERYTNQDLSTTSRPLLAIKAPGLASGVEERPATLQSVFAERFLDAGAEGVDADDILVRRRGEGDQFGTLDFVWRDQFGDGDAIAPQDALTELRR